MNIANKLTTIRVIIVPFFIIFLKLGTKNNFFNYLALLTFIAASITDYFDGYLARKKNLVTNFGKFLDPLADKILTTAAYLCFIKLNLVDVFIVFFVLSREYLVFLIRLLKSKKGIVIAASFWGKLKTVLQIMAIIATICYIIFNNNFLFYLYNFLIYISTFSTVFSGFIYILDNKDLFK